MNAIATKHRTIEQHPLVVAAMMNLQKEGYGIVIDERFYKRPVLPASMLQAYKLEEHEYITKLHSEPAAHVSTNARTTQQLEKVYRDLYYNMYFTK